MTSMHTITRRVPAAARAAAVCFSALFALPDAAEAQVRGEGEGRDSTAQGVAPVVVRGVRAPAVVGGASAVVAAVDSLRLPAAPVLDQALRELPFVLVRRNSRGEMELSVRGSDSRQTAVLVDGLPLTLGWDHRSDPSLVPLTGVQALTVVRGLASLLHGPNVLGGVIEADVAAGATSASPARARVTFASDVDQLGGHGLTLTGSAPLAAGWSARGGVGFRDRPGVARGAGIVEPGHDPDLRTNSDLRQLDGFAALRYAGTGGARLGLTLSGYDAERGVPPELHVAEPRLWRYPLQRRWMGVVSAATGMRATPWGYGNVQASVGANVGRTEIEGFATADYASVVERETGDERTLSTRLLGEHTLGSGGAVLRAAATLADVRYDEGLDDDPVSRYRQRLWSVGSEVTLPVGNAMQLGGGVVLDGADTPETGGKEALGRLTRWGGRLGVTTEVGGGVRLHASASQRSRFPALRELYSGALNRFVPNPTLRPERLLAVEAGATKRWARAELQGVLFQHHLQDAVVRTSTPDRKFRRENRNEIRSSGVELLAAWRHPAGVSLLGDLTAQRVRLLDVQAGTDAQHAEHQPALRAGLDAGVPLPLAARAWVGVRYTGRQYCVHPDLGREVALDGQTTTDLRVEREWSLGRAASALFSRLRASLSLENAADAAVYDQCGLPQPGRTVRLMVEVGG
ncbi:MAG TPA: TonB-dependent receptor [Gemmatimonadaceae bacterium]|nr:TonB-dependent receptor [Gemmatimonadaceae bacterium]